ncbi:hypothetical protein [Pseudomonas migulae]|uniref:hypothetical protein n=1 Tax=Pseudomonas migulae TaxID=78543 RepID=UPI000A05256E|nr:hypothetical protein [Pseudomonas migulae]
MVEILSQSVFKTSLLTTERRLRYRETDINVFKADFFSAFVRFFAVLLAPAVSPAEGTPFNLPGV